MEAAPWHIPGIENKLERWRKQKQRNQERVQQQRGAVPARFGSLDVAGAQDSSASSRAGVHPVHFDIATPRESSSPNGENVQEPASKGQSCVDPAETRRASWSQSSWSGDWRAGWGWSN